MSIVKYVTRSYEPSRISRLEIERESADCIWLKNGRRRNKQGQFSQVHDSFEAARTYLRDQAQQKIDDAKETIAHWHNVLGRINAASQTSPIEDV